VKFDTGECYDNLRTSLILKNAVFWDVVPCRSCVNRRFGGRSVHTRSIQRHIPEDGILHSHGRENFRSYIFNFPSDRETFLTVILHKDGHALLSVSRAFLLTYLPERKMFRTNAVEKN
jgi:hypothetical protein